MTKSHFGDMVPQRPAGEGLISPLAARTLNDRVIRSVDQAWTTLEARLLDAIFEDRYSEAHNMDADDVLAVAWREDRVFGFLLGNENRLDFRCRQYFRSTGPVAVDGWEPRDNGPGLRLVERPQESPDVTVSCSRLLRALGIAVTDVDVIVAGEPLGRRLACAESIAEVVRRVMAPMHAEWLAGGKEVWWAGGLSSAGGSVYGPRFPAGYSLSVRYPADAEDGTAFAQLWWWDDDDQDFHDALRPFGWELDEGMQNEGLWLALPMEAFPEVLSASLAAAPSLIGPAIVVSEGHPSVIEAAWIGPRTNDVRG